MENIDPQSWTSTHIHQSQWLQTTISDLDERLDAMMTILEGGDSPSQKDMHCKWREDLIHMLEDFGQSYRVLAISYNQLKSRTTLGTFHSGSLSSSSNSETISAICNTREMGNFEDKKLEECYIRHPKSTAEGSDIKSDGSNLDFKLLNKQYHELLSVDQCGMKLKPESECRDTQIEDKITDFSTNENDFMKTEGLKFNQRMEDPLVINFKSENTWSTLKHQVIKLTEDNLHQLVELARRNDEKRETIRRLQLEVEDLKRENKALQISPRYSNTDSPRISKSVGISKGNLFRGRSP